MKPDGYLPRKGDVVLIRAVVKYDVEPQEPDGFVFLKTERRSDITCNLDEIVDVVGRTWNVNDRVILKGAAGLGFGKVLAIDGDWHWIKMEDGGFGTYRSLDLEAAPPELSIVAQISDAMPWCDVCQGYHHAQAPHVGTQSDKTNEEIAF